MWSPCGMPGRPAGGSGMSVTTDSVVSTTAATLDEFSTAARVTLAGATTSIAIIVGPAVRLLGPLFMFLDLRQP